MTTGHDIRAEILRIERQIENANEELTRSQAKADQATRDLIAGDSSMLDISATARGRVETLRIVLDNLKAKKTEAETSLSAIERADAVEGAIAACAVEADAANEIFREIIAEQCRLGLNIERAFKKIEMLNADLADRRGSFLEHFEILAPGVARRLRYLPPSPEVQSSVIKYLEDIRSQNQGVSTDIVCDSTRETWIKTLAVDPNRAEPSRAPWEQEAVFLLAALHAKESERVAALAVERRATSDEDSSAVFSNYRTPKPAPRICVMPSGSVPG